MCTICGGKIEDGRATPSDGVAFNCAKHGGYAIARSALPRWMQMDVRNQEARLDRAKLFASVRSGEIIVTSLDL